MTQKYPLKIAHKMMLMPVYNIFTLICFYLYDNKVNSMFKYWYFALHILELHVLDHYVLKYIQYEFNIVSIYAELRCV